MLFDRWLGEMPKQISMFSLKDLRVRRNRNSPSLEIIEITVRNPRLFARYMEFELRIRFNPFFLSSIDRIETAPIIDFYYWNPRSLSIPSRAIYFRLNGERLSPATFLNVTISLNDVGERLSPFQRQNSFHQRYQRNDTLKPDIKVRCRLPRKLR